MKFDHLVKHNGVYYKPGEDVPVEGNTPSAEALAVETKTEEVSEVKVEAETKTDVAPEKEYTKTEINRMSTAELRKLASKVGIENVDEYVGSELKTMLIERLV